jgi:hypothetical protein
MCVMDFTMTMYCPKNSKVFFTTRFLWSHVVKKTFEFLGQYIKFHEVDLGIISQFQYKHECTTYENVSDQD